jgi:ureidoglycolate hydrolase
MKNGVEILDYRERGFKPVMSFGTWRLAMLNYCEEAGKAIPASAKLEKHLKTDEVFVLLAGKADLIVGEDGEDCRQVQVIAMEGGKIYNVKQFVWHHIVMNEDAHVLLVEENDTGVSNTKYLGIGGELRSQIASQLSF